MHGLEGPEGVRRNVGVGHHHEIEITLVGLEVTNRERAVKIHADEMITENRLCFRQQLLEDRVDLWVVDQGKRRLGHGQRLNGVSGSGAKRTGAPLATIPPEESQCQVAIRAAAAASLRVIRAMPSGSTSL